MANENFQQCLNAEFLHDDMLLDINYFCAILQIKKFNWIYFQNLYAFFIKIYDQILVT